MSESRDKEIKMNGSEKQINWANDIINSTRERMQRVASEAQARYDHLAPLCTAEQLEKETVFLQARQIATGLVLAHLDEIESAKYVIDNRGNLGKTIFDKYFKGISADEMAVFQALAKRISSSEFYGFILN